MKKVAGKKAIGLVGAGVLLSGIILGSLGKLSVVWGSKSFVFSLINIIAPLTGSLFGVFGATSFLATFFVARKLLGFGIITWGLPTVCASGKWALDVQNNTKNLRSWGFLYCVLNFVISVVLPVLCMVLFIVHPVGQKAFIYSFYWLIPVIIYLSQYFGKKIFEKLSLGSIFLTALGSTFIAHAVGSVLFLYMVPMGAARWIALIPVVAVERFVFAAGSTVLYVFVRIFVGNFYATRRSVLFARVCKKCVKN